MDSLYSTDIFLRYVAYIGITRSPLPQNNGNLPSHFFGVNEPIAILHHIY